MDGEDVLYRSLLLVTLAFGSVRGIGSLVYRVLFDSSRQGLMEDLVDFRDVDHEVLGDGAESFCGRILMATSQAKSSQIILTFGIRCAFLRTKP